MIKAIETRYKGYRFRSRLEARWAVFLDAVGLVWEYEPEGFRIGRVMYLPDFWVPDLKSWLEIKPHTPSPAETDKTRRFFIGMRDASPPISRPGMVHTIVGNPWPNAYRVYSPAGVERPVRWTICPMCETLNLDGFSDLSIVVEGQSRLLWAVGCRARDRRNYADMQQGRNRDWWNASGDAVYTNATGEMLGGSVFIFADPLRIIQHPRLMGAYETARSARFEHGETPKPEVWQ